jgi:RecA-family ATPase
VRTEILDFGNITDPAAKSEAVAVFKRLHWSDIQELEDPAWIIENLIPEDAFVVMYGAPGSFKSFNALAIACCIATGTPFHGDRTEMGKVIYCVGEGLRGYKWRIQAWLLANPTASPVLLEDNLIIIEDVPRLLIPAQAAMLRATARLVQAEDDIPLRLFVVDTLARSMVGGDENSAKDMGVVIDACEDVRRDTGATPLVLHHSGNEKGKPRGSTALHGAEDTLIAVTLDEALRRVEMRVEKMKDGERGRLLRFGIAQFGHSVALQKQETLADSSWTSKNENGPY